MKPSPFMSRAAWINVLPGSCVPRPSISYSSSAPAKTALSRAVPGAAVTISRTMDMSPGLIVRSSSSEVSDRPPKAAAEKSGRPSAPIA